MSKIQLGVMFGSRSCEHEVSIISAVPSSCAAADRELYDVIPIYISKRGRMVHRRRAASRSRPTRPLTKAARAWCASIWISPPGPAR